MNVCVPLYALTHSCKGNASQQNIEISTDTTRIEKNNFDRGLRVITTLEPPPFKNTTPAHLRVCETHYTHRK